MLLLSEKKCHWKKECPKLAKGKERRGSIANDRHGEDERYPKKHVLSIKML